MQTTKNFKDENEKEDKNKIYQLLELIYPDKSKEVLDNIINNIDNDISSDYLGNEFKDWDQKPAF